MSQTKYLVISLVHSDAIDGAYDREPEGVFDTVEEAKAYIAEEGALRLRWSPVPYFPTDQH